VRYGKPGAPSWATALILAEKWGVPPWDIMERRGSLRWAARQSALDEARRRSAEFDKK
jgi:hypothetical protein